MITYPQHVQDALQELRDKGFAICIFTPKELNETDPQLVEDTMIAAGWEVINQDPNNQEFDWENEEEEYPD